MDSDAIIFSAPGKVILFGEHAVVYGHPAIVMAINLRARCITSKSSRQTFTLDPPKEYPDDMYIFDEGAEDFVLERNSSSSVIYPALYFIAKTVMEKSATEKYPHISLQSEIPPLAGLGSSAAIAVATISSISTYMGLDFQLEEINEIAFSAEKIIHGKPSGVDNTISTFGGIHYYKKKKFKRMLPKMPSSYIMIINSGITRNTSTYVEKVSQLVEKNPYKYDKILENIGAITKEAKTAMIQGDIERIGELMNQNQKFLEMLEVGHPVLSSLLKQLEKNGALGSKITGAGGGGSIIGLFDNYQKASLAVKAVKGKGYEAFVSDLSERGVLREK